MGARCTQSPISALYGVPRAFMRNHVQVGPSDTQSEMVAVGQAWGGEGWHHVRGYWPQTLRASADICSTEGLGPGMSTDVEMVVVLRLQLHIPSGLQDVQQLNGHDVDALPPQRGGGGGVFGRNRGSHPKWRNHHKSKSSISNVSTSPNMSPRHITLQMLPQSGMCRLR